MTLYIGCGPIPPRRGPYFERFSCAELSETMFKPIRYKTLRGWNAERPDGFDYVLGVHRWIGLEPLDEREPPPLDDFAKKEFGLFADTDANRALWAETAAQAEALAANAVIIRTPPGFSPSAQNRDNLGRFLRDVVGDVPYDFVWEARGLWTPADRADLATELGITAVVDPYDESAFPEVPSAASYYTVTAPNGRVRFSREDFFELAEFLNEHENDVRVIFRGPEREWNAGHLLKALESFY